MDTVFKDFALEGKTALVTGGATGLGYHMARALARAGARVMIVARRENLLADAVTQLNSEFGASVAQYRTCDLLDPKSISALVETVKGQFGDLDIFVGNAGDTFPEQITDLTMEGVEKTFQLNVFSNMELVKQFLPGMQRKKWGRIILSSSIGSIMALAGQGTSTYNATKAAVNSFARTVAADMGHYNITANAIVLGFFMTDLVKGPKEQIRQEMGEEASDAFLKLIIECTATGRIADPSEIEGLITLLASDAGKYITGASIPIDGGMSIMMRPLAVEN
jgi:NAD(P)-dependent dehydrogenase (short-subunit alcohol dehydrogenase family)